MKRSILILILSFTLTNIMQSQASVWSITGNKIVTPWAEKINPLNPLPDYPRPQMVRNLWKNLNGLWDYAIIAKSDLLPQKFDGKILVPFAVESALSGVNKQVGPDKMLCYRTKFMVPAEMRAKTYCSILEQWTGNAMFILMVLRSDRIREVMIHSASILPHMSKAENNISLMFV